MIVKVNFKALLIAVSCGLVALGLISGDVQSVVSFNSIVAEMMVALILIVGSIFSFALSFEKK